MVEIITVLIIIFIAVSGLYMFLWLIDPVDCPRWQRGYNCKGSRCECRRGR